MKKNAFLLTIFAVAAVSALCVTQTLRAEDDWQREADARIEKHRKTDVAITVTRDGKPISAAEVRVQMKKHAFLFGCNLFMLGQCGEPELDRAYETRFAELLNFATLPFYWWDYEHEKGKPDHARREKMAHWCAEHGILAKGHPLMWNFWQNQWMNETSAEELWKLQQARITDCVTRFEKQIPVWDVVNELVQFDRGECAERAPQLTEAIKARGRVEAVKECFRSARAANPEAVLLVNDYMTYDDYAGLLDELRGADGKLIFDVVGIQSHMHGGRWDNQRIVETCERFEKFGLPVHFTEMTIVSGQEGWGLENWASTPEGEERQAREVARIYTMLFSQPVVAAITWWDFSDRGAWMNAPSGLLRQDMTPKPAYDALHGLIKNAWWTDETVKTDGNGSAKTRVFRGDYEITVTLADGTQKTFTTAFTGDAENRFTAEMAE